MLKELIDALPEETLLVITSDHGLIENGHGGSSPEERLAVFMAYRKRGFSLLKDPSLAKVGTASEAGAEKSIVESSVDGVDLSVMLALMGEIRLRSTVSAM